MSIIHVCSPARQMRETEASRERLPKQPGVVRDAWTDRETNVNIVQGFSIWIKAYPNQSRHAEKCVWTEKIKRWPDSHWCEVHLQSITRNIVPIHGWIESTDRDHPFQAVCKMRANKWTTASKKHWSNICVFETSSKILVESLIIPWNHERRVTSVLLQSVPCIAFTDLNK